METYQETLKSLLNDEAYSYRRDAFLQFLKAPIRTYKESPTVKDYVEISEDELKRMILGSFPETSKDRVPLGNHDILVNNENVSFSSSLQDRGIIVSDLKSAISSNKDLMEKYVYPRLGDDRDEFLINSAWRNGLFVFIPDNTDVVINVENMIKSEVSIAQKYVIISGKNANVTYSDNFGSAGQGDGIQGKTIYFFLGEGTKVHYHYFQEKFPEVTDITYVKEFMDKYSEFAFYHANRGAYKTIFTDKSVQFGEMSTFKVAGVSFSSGSQKMSITDSSFQEAETTVSDIHVRGVVTGNSSTIHKGSIDLEENSKKSTGFYDSRILLLSKDGYANSKPALMIKNSNTRSKHGSSISNVDDEQIFYLSSRGIPRNIAKGIITTGFVSSILDSAEDKRFMERVYKLAEDLGSNVISAPD